MVAQRLEHAVTLRRPGLGLRLADALGTVAVLRPGSYRAPASEKLTAVLGPLKPATIRRLRRQIAGLHFRNEALAEIIRRRGINPIVPLVATVHAEPLLRLRHAGVPIIVVAWHNGPNRAVALAVQKLGMRALFAVLEVLGETDREDDTVRYADLQSGANNSRFLKRAHQALADGIVVGLMLDWYGVASVAVPFFGRGVEFARGPASLARLTGARLVPATSRFMGRSSRIEVTFHEPIEDADLDRGAAATFESVLLRRTAERFEAEARRDLGSLRPDRIEWLLAAPVVADSGGLP